MSEAQAIKILRLKVRVAAALQLLLCGTVLLPVFLLNVVAFVMTKIAEPLGDWTNSLAWKVFRLFPWINQLYDNKRELRRLLGK